MRSHIVEDAEIAGVVSAIGDSLAESAPAPPSIETRVAARRRRRTQRGVALLVLSMLAGASALIALKDRGPSRQVVSAGQAARVTVNAQLVDGTQYEVSFAAMPGAHAPELAASAPVRLRGCCPYATAIIRKRSTIRDTSEDRTLGSWQLPSGQQASLVDRRGRSMILIDAGPWVLAIAAPEVGQDLAAAERATADLTLLRATDRGPVLDPTAIDDRGPQQITTDLGTSQPFLSLLKRQCSGGPIVAAGDGDRAMLSRCFQAQGVVAIAQGDSESDVRQLLTSVEVVKG